MALVLLALAEEAFPEAATYEEHQVLRKLHDSAWTTLASASASMALIDEICYLPEF